MDVFLMILKSLGMSFGICAIVLFFVLAGTLFWVRRMAQDRVYCFFLSESKQLKGKLLKAESNTVIVGTGENAPKYLIHSTKQFWSPWPPGFPKFVQEPVPTYFYVESNAEPLDPYDRKSLISPESLRKISDESMLKQMWKDVRETLGIKRAFGGNTLLLILVSVAIVASGIAAYLSFQNIDQIGAITKATEEIMKALGIGP